MLLDRRRVKFWQKIIFSFMALLMVVFALGVGVTQIGCNQQGGISPSDQVKKAAARVKKNPDNATAVLALANAWLTLGRQQNQGSDAEAAALKKAAKAFERYLKLQKDATAATAVQDRISATEALVSIYTALQEYEPLTAAYGSLTALQPENADNYVLYGQAAEKAGRTQIALLAYTKYLELAPHGLYAKDVKDQIKKLEKQATASPSP